MIPVIGDIFFKIPKAAQMAGAVIECRTLAMIIGSSLCQTGDQWLVRRMVTRNSRPVEREGIPFCAPASQVRPAGGWKGAGA